MSQIISKKSFFYSLSNNIFETVPIVTFNPSDGENLAIRNLDFALFHKESLFEEVKGDVINLEANFTASLEFLIWLFLYSSENDAFISSAWFPKTIMDSEIF